ncbi:hypothetical protein LCGC14_2612230, partial [marine sediment metagenome]
TGNIAVADGSGQQTFEMRINFGTDTKSSIQPSGTQDVEELSLSLNAIAQQVLINAQDITNIIQSITDLENRTRVPYWHIYQTAILPVES